MLSPLNAKLTRDTDWFGKGDPYCIVEVGKVKKRTEVHGGGGKNPKWKGDYNWSFEVENFLD